MENKIYFCCTQCVNNPWKCETCRWPDGWSYSIGYCEVYIAGVALPQQQKNDHHYEGGVCQVKL